ncbi:MAG: hypothetical protein H7A36_08090, partial [Chlamydiales bacterium]|nr:hypothetical protein [Chlamydiales bacterium]
MRAHFNFSTLLFGFVFISISPFAISQEVHEEKQAPAEQALVDEATSDAGIHALKLDPKLESYDAILSKLRLPDYLVTSDLFQGLADGSTFEIDSKTRTDLHREALQKVAEHSLELALIDNDSERIENMLREAILLSGFL